MKCEPSCWIWARGSIATARLFYGTEPWIVSGEGPTQVKTGFATDQEMKPYTSSDFPLQPGRAKNLYVISLACPADGTATVHALGLAGEARGKVIRDVDLLGSSQKVDWLQTTNALSVKLAGRYRLQIWLCFACQICAFQTGRK